MHLVENFFKIVIVFFFWMNVHSFVSSYHKAVVYGQSLHLLLHIEPRMRTSIIAAAITQKKKKRIYSCHLI